MSAASKAEGTAKTTASGCAKSNAKAQSVKALTADATLMQKLRLYWQLGDWAALNAITLSDIETIENRAEAALYIAAACFQLADIAKAKTHLTLAQQWGVDNSLLQRVLVSGVYNNLALASTLVVPDALPDAQRHFAIAAEIALPGMAVPAVVKARTHSQLEHFNQLGVSLTAYTMQQLLRQELPPTNLAMQGTIAAQLQQHYIADDRLRIWHRPQQHDFSYSDGDAVEQRILAAIRGCSDVSVFSEELLAHQIDWPSEYHLSADRVNLLRPFAEKLRQSNVLELGCGCGAITRYLGETANYVVAVEGSQQRATIAAERCRDLANVSVVLDKLQDAPFSGQFDVVTLIGVLEYSQIYVDAEDPIKHVLQKVLSYLADDGILIVAIENQLGLKYFAGAPEDHGVGVMAGINDLYTDKTAITFGKQELEQRLRSAGFADVQTYLPLPDYKLPCLMVHPQGYAFDDRFNLGELLASTAFYDRQGIAAPLFSLEAAWPVIARNGLAADLANSHVFVASKKVDCNITPPAVLACYYSPKRTADTSQELVFFNDGQDIKIRRQRLGQGGSEPEATLEPYINGSLHSQLLHKVLQKPGWTLADVQSWLQTWLDALLSQIVPCNDVPADWPTYDKYLPANYIDAIPRNLIIANNGFKQFIDLEWTVEHLLPLPLVLYRGLVVTLSTITSVASPADACLINRQTLLDALLQYCGYQLTAQDYAVFMPIMDVLSRKAQGLALPENLCSKPVVLKPFTLRATGGSNTIDRTITMALYWATANNGFAEDNSVKINYQPLSSEQEISLSLPLQTEAYSKLRLDIADRPGSFIVSHFAFSDSDGNTVWQWDCDVEQLKHVGQLSFYRNTSDSSSVCMLSEGNDPQFELNIAEPTLQALSVGAKMNISLRTFI